MDTNELNYYIETYNTIFILKCRIPHFARENLTGSVYSHLDPVQTPTLRGYKTVIHWVQLLSLESRGKLFSANSVECYFFSIGVSKSYFNYSIYAGGEVTLH